MAKGNKFINKSLAKDVENGCIIQELPEIKFGRRMFSLFSSISPTHCIICGNTLNPNEHYDRSVISSYGTIRCPITYWICSNPNCKKHHHDILVGVTGSANYSDEYIEKIKCSYTVDLANPESEDISVRVMDFESRALSMAILVSTERT